MGRLRDFIHFASLFGHGRKRCVVVVVAMTRLCRPTAGVGD
jgi:hypothetical protein